MTRGRALQKYQQHSGNVELAGVPRSQNSSRRVQVLNKRGTATRTTTRDSLILWGPAWCPPTYIYAPFINQKKPPGRPITSRPTVQPNILSPTWDLLILGSLGFRPHRALRHCGLSFMDYALALKKKVRLTFWAPFFRNVDHRVDFESCPSLRLGAYNTFLWRSSRLKRYILQEGRRWRSMTASPKVRQNGGSSVINFFVVEMLL